MFVSYAQNFEDVMLWRALKSIKQGFYVDVGAQDPVVDSVSKGFYEKGWRGVHVEPTPAYVDKLRQDRPDETVLQYAVGDGEGSIRFFEFPQTGLSTGDSRIALARRAEGWECTETEVELVSLAAVFDRFMDKDIHWLKIDVEGMEASVLKSWGDHPTRPWVVVVESTVPLSPERVETTWQQLITVRGYDMCYFDGLNCYFVDRKRSDLKSAFASPPNLFDEFTLSGTATSSIGKLMASRIVKAKADLDSCAKNEVSLHAQLDDARQRELELVQANLECRTQAEHLHTQVESLHRSFSWRAMAPYRILARGMRREFRRLPELVRRVAGLLRRGFHFLLRVGVETAQNNPRLHNLARKLIYRYPSLRGLVRRSIMIARGQPSIPAQSHMMMPVGMSRPNSFVVTDEELATLSRVGRINARRIGLL